VQDIAGYVFDHTSRDAGRWHRLAAAERGPLLVSAVHAPREAEFLRLIRLHREKSPGCNPLDGREHSIGEIGRWLGIKALAVRFVGLGVILGVFELTSRWESPAGGDHQDPQGRPEQLDGLRFRLEGSRPREVIGGSGYGACAPSCRRRPGPRMPRQTRRRRARSGAMRRAGVK